MLGPEDLAAPQGFPVGFRFHGNRTSQYRQIGNAFPPHAAEAIGRALAGQDPAADQRGRYVAERRRVSQLRRRRRQALA